MKEYPNVILISGSGRNVGKTSLICKIIEKYAETETLISIKISPHFHPLTDRLILLRDTQNCKIAIETDQTGNKDTAKFLKSGVMESFFIQSNDDEVLEAFTNVVSKYSNSHLFIVESGALKKFVRPGLSIFVADDSSQKQYKSYPDIDVALNENDDFAEFTKKISIKNNTWNLLTN